MAQNYIAGWGTTVKYDYETSFGSGGTPANAFGHGTKITLKRNNNQERIYGIGSRNTQQTVTKKFEGTMTIDFVLGNTYFLKAVLGAQGAAGGAGPYTHAYTEANTPPSITVSMSSDLGSNDMVTTYSGVVVTSCKISMAVNETVKVSLDCLYQTETTAASGSFADVLDTISEPMTFAMGTVTYAGQSMGNTYSGQVQNCELTINNNAEMLYGLGSRLTQQAPHKNREYNFRMTYALVSIANSEDVFENMLGDTSTPFIPNTGNITGVDLVLTITNGGATTALRSLVWTFTSAKTFINTSSMVFDANEVLKDDIDGWAESISTCVGTDNNNSGLGT